MKFSPIHKPILILCVSASIALHSGAVWYVYSNPLFFETSHPPALTSAPVLKMIPKEEADLLVERMERALEESMNKIIAVAHKEDLQAEIAVEESSKEDQIQPVETVPPIQVIKQEPPPPAAPKEEPPLVIRSIENEFAATLPPLFDPEHEASLADFALNDDFEEEVVPHNREKHASVDFSEQPLPATPAAVTHDDYTMTDQQFSPDALPTHRGDKLDPQFLSSLKKLSPSPVETTEPAADDKLLNHIQENTALELILPNTVDYLRSQWVKQSLVEGKLPDLKDYGLDEIAKTIEWEERLDVDVQLMAVPGGNHYVFSLTIQPGLDTACESLQQNFYFLIDRSSSIESHKFSRFKRAAARSLAALQEGDNFNIYLFDREITKLSQSPIPVTPQSIAQAESFLNEQNAKTHFAATELYTSLDKMLPAHFDPNQLHSVILISDGNTSLSSRKQRHTIAEWMKKFEGNVNFYTAAAGKGNNLVLLDLISYLSAGKMLYSDTNAGFPRKLVRFIKDLHDPILKDVSIEVTPRDGNAKLNLYPARKELLPPMFAGQPYEIVGTVDELCDLTLFVQGRNRGKWVAMRKKISLKDVISGTHSLEKTWAITKSKLCYDHFITDGKDSFLQEAVQTVAPHKGIIALEQ